jgi:hypothetical protein
MPEERMKFIPDLRDAIRSRLLREAGAVLTEEIITEAFRKWDAGEEPATPWESGCFEVFRKVQSDVNQLELPPDKRER